MEPLNGATAISGGRFRANGEEFHLSDILAPSEYDLHRDSEPYFHEAKAMLSKIIVGRTLEITSEGERNRWGARQVTLRCTGDEASVQEQLVAAGAVRVKPTTDDRELIESLLSAERSARRGQKGLWSLTAYRIVSATNANHAVGGFHLVEGVVTSAKAGRGRYYLNFGADYREDFTATAPSRLARRWRKAGVDLDSLQDAHIRVRGFVEWINGPSIELGHVKTIERIG